MEIILVSDSHRMRGFQDILKRRYPKADYFFHCGDSELSKEEMRGWAVVEGNCDYFFEFPQQLVIEVEGHSFLLLHGHQQPRPYTDSLPLLARKNRCDIVCYGHTHVPMDQMADGIRLLNPGSLRYNRDASVPSYMVLHVMREKIDASLIRYEP